MTHAVLSPVELAHARLAVALVTAAREGIEPFLDRYGDLLEDIEQDEAHPLRRELRMPLIEWWLARMALAFAEDAAWDDDAVDDPIGEMLRGWAIGLELPADDEAAC